MESGKVEFTHYCLHESDWGKVMEAVENIKASSADAVICQAELKKLIIESQKTLIEHAQKIKSIPSPNSLRIQAVLSGSATALVVFAIYKFL